MNSLERAVTGLDPAQRPERGSFIDPLSNQTLASYFRAVYEKFAYATNFGMALDDEDIGAATRRPVMLNSLFVPPRLSTQQVSPASLIEAEQTQGDLGLAEVYRVLQDKPRLFILGDPGTGKTTLVNWLMLALTYSGDNHVKGALGPLVPFAMALRDIDLTAIGSWDDLWQAYLRASSPWTVAVRDDPEILQALCRSGQALFLLDGLDEVTAPPVRKRLAEAVLEGMQRHPRCAFVITSRIVGFSQSEWLGRQAEKQASLFVSEEERIPPYIGAHERGRAEGPKLPVVYLAPFDSRQIERFVGNWYRQYVPVPATHGERTADLLSRVLSIEGLGQLARIPVLLNMICFIHARRGRLPDGRAELYQRIAETYLVGLDRARGLKFKGRELNVDYQDLTEWLGRLALHMQERRGEGNEAVLVAESEVEGNFRAGMQDKGLSEDESRREFRFILDYIAQRSGILIPRGEQQGEEHYAFSHLSFQEFFAARELFAGVMFMTKDDWDRHRQRAQDPAWREALILMFELMPSARHADHCVRELFGETGGRLAIEASQNAVNAWGLLAAVAMNTAVRFSRHVRATLIEGAWEALFDERIQKTALGDLTLSVLVQPLWSDGFDSLDNFRSRVRDCTTLQLGGDRVADLTALGVAKGLKTLSLEGTAVSDLTPLMGLENLEALFVDNSAVSDLTPLAALSGVEWLSLENTQVRDLTPLARLTGLKALSLNNTSVADLVPLAGLSRLKWLWLNNTRVVDLMPLAGLSRLEGLILDHTQVQDLAPLVGLGDLKRLSLDNTQAADLTPLAGLSGLERLWLSNTQVADLTPLAGLSGLKELWLNNTQVADLAPLAGLSGLERLWLVNTPVEDFGSVRRDGLRVFDGREN